MSLSLQQVTQISFPQTVLLQLRVPSYSFNVSLPLPPAPSHRIHESSDGTMLDNRSFQANGNVRHESVNLSTMERKIFQFSVLFFPFSVMFLLLFLFVFFKIVISHVKYLSTCALVLAYLKCLLPLAQLYDWCDGNSRFASPDKGGASPARR